MAAWAESASSALPRQMNFRAGKPFTGSKPATGRPRNARRENSRDKRLPSDTNGDKISNLP